MRKFTSILIVLLFSLSLYAQERVVESPKSQEMYAKKQAEIERIQEAQAGQKYLEARPIPIKGFQKLSNTISEEEVFWTDDLEGDVSGWQNVDLTAVPVFTAPSTFNAYEGMSWWCGTETDNWTGYGNGWVQYLTTTESYDLSGASSAAFKYYLRYDVEPDFDYVYVQVSVDGGETWETLETYTGMGTTWTEYEVDLSDYTGEAAVWVRLLMTSDSAYSDEDGDYESDGGAYQFDNARMVVDGTETLIDDGGDTVTGFIAESAEPVGAYWTLVDTDAASGTYSFQSQNYVSGALFALVSEEIDLSTITPGSSLFLDFLYQGIDLVTQEASFGSEDFLYMELSGNGGQTWSGINNFGYQPTEGFSSWRDGAGGNTELSEYIGGTVMVRWVFHANTVGKDAASAEAGVYIDDPTLLVLSDPYEPNNSPSTATVMEFPFQSDGALIAPGDTDVYTFSAEAGQWVNIYIDNSVVDVEVLMASLDAGGSPSYWFIPSDPNRAYYSDGAAYDQIIINTYTAGNYVIRVRNARDLEGNEIEQAGAYTLWAYSPNPTPELTNLRDVPNDEGLQLRASYDHSDFTDPFLIPWQLRVEKYYIERRNALSWDYVREIPVVANGTNNTNVVVPTLADDAATSFKLIAETNLSTSMIHPIQQGTFIAMEPPRTLYARGFKYFEDVATGTSVDNLKPVIVGTDAARVSEGVKVSWEVQDAPDLLRYVVKRSEVSGQEGEVVYSSEALDRKSFVDANADIDYFYVVEVHDDGNNVTSSKEVNPSITSVDGDAGLPTVYSLDQNYPNPFNPATTIKFGIPVSSKVAIKVYDILGQEVANIVNTNLAAGYHTYSFDASDLNSGMYIYRINAQGIDGKNFVDTRKMLLVK